MGKTTRRHLDNLGSEDGDRRYAALLYLLKATDQPVDWAYDVWDGFVKDLRDRDSHVWAIAAQLLCGLAKSDPQNRMIKDFDALMVVTRDERFVTARHCLQSLWKVGAAGKKQQKTVLDRLGGRFADCAAEKNCTLIRYDIVQGLRNLCDEVKDEKIRTKALELIETEQDLMYRTKYAGVWKTR